MSVYTMGVRDDDVKGILVHLEIMMSRSSSTTTCERRFACTSLQASISTSLSNQSLNNIMRMCSVYKFKAEDHINSCTANSKGKRNKAL